MLVRANKSLKNKKGWSTHHSIPRPHFHLAKHPILLISQLFDLFSPISSPFPINMNDFTIYVGWRNFTNLTQSLFKISETQCPSYYNYVQLWHNLKTQLPKDPNHSTEKSCLQPYSYSLFFVFSFILGGLIEAIFNIQYSNFKHYISFTGEIDCHNIHKQFNKIKNYIQKQFISLP